LKKISKDLRGSVGAGGGLGSFILRCLLKYCKLSGSKKKLIVVLISP